MSEKSSESLRKSKLSTIGVVALIFSFVAAGAFGIEEAIAASGPGLTLIMLLVFPFVWAFPLCEMVGELGSILRRVLGLADRFVVRVDHLDVPGTVLRLGGWLCR